MPSNGAPSRGCLSDPSAGRETPASPAGGSDLEDLARGPVPSYSTVGLCVAALLNRLRGTGMTTMAGDASEGRSARGDRSTQTRAPARGLQWRSQPGPLPRHRPSLTSYQDVHHSPPASRHPSDRSSSGRCLPARKRQGCWMVSRPGFDGGSHSPRGCEAWQHHGSTRRSYESERSGWRWTLAGIR